MIIKFDVYGTSCHMTVNLEEICKTEGKKVKVGEPSRKVGPEDRVPSAETPEALQANHREQLRRDPGRCGAISDRQLQDLRPRVRRAKEVIV